MALWKRPAGSASRTAAVRGPSHARSRGSTSSQADYRLAGRPAGLLAAEGDYQTSVASAAIGGTNVLRPTGFTGGRGPARWGLAISV